MIEEKEIDWGLPNWMVPMNDGEYIVLCNDRMIIRYDGPEFHIVVLFKDIELFGIDSSEFQDEDYDYHQYDYKIRTRDGGAHSVHMGKYDKDVADKITNAILTGILKVSKDE